MRGSQLRLCCFFSVSGQRNIDNKIYFSVIFPTARHSLKNFFTCSIGVPNFPEYVASGSIDDTQFVYCNTSKRIVEGKSDWFKEWLQNQDNFKIFQERCFAQAQPIGKNALNEILHDLNLHEGVHILQALGGCEVDYYKNQSSRFFRLGFDGEDFVTLDMNSLAWISQNDRATSIKHKWDLDKGRTDFFRYYYTIECPIQLSELLKVSNTFYILSLNSGLQYHIQAAFGIHAWRRQVKLGL
uniref:MHC class I-like antigen recognition-like domain-containing protein n=1 Tax=Cyprinodon variegatus TaxID=28743 RepID=A0A3Q2D4G1_CYPVA